MLTSPFFHLQGSHFLCSWLMCVPRQLQQPHLTEEQQINYLLRALGAVRLLRSRQRIIPDEAGYRRCVLDLCKRHWFLSSNLIISIKSYRSLRTILQ